MGLFRRRARNPDAERWRDAFADVAGRVDAAQRALLAAIPTSRDPGVPLAQALAAFGSHLSDAAAKMEAWRAEATLHEWTTCSRALADAREAAEALRVEPATPSFEQLNARVGDVLHPLESFADAERALRRM